MGMRTIAPLALALSLVLTSPSPAVTEVKFEADPIVTVELHEGVSSYALIYYGFIGAVVLYTVASLKSERIHRLNQGLTRLIANRI